MSEPGLDRLIAAARRAPVPELSVDLAGRIVRTAQQADVAVPASLMDELNRLFPRLAWAAVALIVLCVAGDWGHSRLAGPDLADGATQWLEHWLAGGT